MTVNFLKVKDIVDRVYADFLYPSRARPTQLSLTTNIGNDADTFTYNDSSVPPEESDLIASGVVLEINSEQMVAGSVNTAINTISNLTRGYNGTPKTSHSTGDLITVAPEFPRFTVFNAVADAIAELFPRLYTTSIAESVTVSKYLAEVPDDAIDVLSVYENAKFNVQIPFTYLPNTSSVPSSKAVQVYTSSSVDIKYRAKPHRPLDEENTLSSINVDNNWVGVIVIGSLLNLMNIPDIAALMSDFIMDALSAQTKSSQGGANIRDSMLQLYEYRMTKLVSARQVEEHYDDAIEQFVVI